MLLFPDKLDDFEETKAHRWNGIFRFLWAVKGESEDFVVYLTENKKWTEIKRAAVKNNVACLGT